MTVIRVEFFGIPRRRAGVSGTESRAMLLGQILRDIGSRFPKLAEACIDGQQLRQGYLASVNGDRFVSDPATPLEAGDCLLILSADAGG